MIEFFNALKKCNYIYNKEQKRITFFVLICSILGAGLEMLGVSSILPFADVLLQSEEAYASTKYSFIIQLFNLNSAEQLILVLAVGIALIYILKNLYFIFLSWVRAQYAAKLDRELSIKMLKSYMSKGYTFFVNTNTGALIQGTKTDVEGAKLLVYNAMKLLTDLLSIIFISMYLIAIDWQLALGVGTMAIICFVVIGKVFSLISLRAGKTARKYQAKANQKLLQAFQGIKEVLVLKKEKYFTKAYSKDYEIQLRMDKIRVICGEIPSYIIEGACVAAIFVIICIRIMGNGVSDELLPVLASFVVASFKILPAIGKMTSEYSAMSYYYAALDSVYNNFVEVCNDEDAIDDNKKTDEQEITFKNNIRLNDLVFSYEDEKDIINQLNMTINKGEAIAFVGPSGSGKTTLSDIVLGLLKPQSGSVLVDGVNISDSPYEWSKMVGYVSQTMYLVDDSIRVNVAFGVDEDEIDDDKVWECLKRAQIDQYVNGLEDGIYTTVGDRGLKISGGQRQRIAIARALYHNPQILILDEATSALDNETEKAVMESIDALQGEITMIIVAHRLSTVKNCNRIYEINNGVAIEKNKDDIF